ncbi:hypothetical protein [Spirosoma harenae]
MPHYRFSPSQILYVSGGYSYSNIHYADGGLLFPPARPGLSGFPAHSKAHADQSGPGSPAGGNMATEPALWQWQMGIPYRLLSAIWCRLSPF